MAPLDRIPLFPLNTVLFPGVPLPLRVFEERYHLMLDACRDEGRNFGVVLIREGEEVGGEAEPHAVGTEARIEERADADRSGEVLLLARGTRRFRIEATRRERPFLEGDVAWLPEPEEDDPGAEDAAREVAARFEAYLRLLTRLTRAEVAGEVEAVVAAQQRAGPWELACAVGGTMLVPPEDKQPILEVRRADEALIMERRLLDRELARLQMLEHRGDPRRN